MHKLKHALSGATYELDEEGRVLVVTPDGISGIFTGDGVWVSGELRTADPEMCRWIRSGNNTSPRLKSSRRFTALTSSLRSQS